MWYFSRYDFDFNEIYNEGLDLYKRKQYKSALGKFKLAVSRFPDRFQAHYNLGLCALKLKSFSQAKDAFNQALQLNKRDVDTIYNLGYVEMCLNNYEKAKEHFNLILQTYPEESDVLFNLGYIFGMEKNYEKAKTYIEKAIEISPEKTGYKKFYIEILDPLFEQKGSPKMLDEMLDLCLELLVIYPNDENLIYKTAVIYAKMGDWENSVNYCERLFNQNPNSHKACSQYGLTLFCKGETIRAIEMYERAIKIAPDIPDSYLNLVFAYDKIGEVDSAAKLVETFIKKFPKDPSIEMAKDYLERRAEENEQEEVISSIDKAILPEPIIIQENNETENKKTNPQEIDLEQAHNENQN